MILERIVLGFFEWLLLNILSEIVFLKIGVFDLNDINVIKIGYRVIKVVIYIFLLCCLLM